jgi:hypothetical protein
MLARQGAALTAQLGRHVMLTNGRTVAGTVSQVHPRLSCSSGPRFATTVAHFTGGWRMTGVSVTRRHPGSVWDTYETRLHHLSAAASSQQAERTTNRGSQAAREKAVRVGTCWWLALDAQSKATALVGVITRSPRHSAAKKKSLDWQRCTHRGSGTQMGRLGRSTGPSGSAAGGGETSNRSRSSR